MSSPRLPATAAVIAAMLVSVVPVGVAHAVKKREPPPAVWSLDPAHTTVAFSIDATGFPRTDGAFRKFDGAIRIDLDHPVRSSIDFNVEAKSVDVGSDLLADMLRGRSFLDVEHYTGISFVSQEVEKLDARTVRVTGNLTLLGVTRPLSVDVEVRRLAEPPHQRLGFTAKAQIDRLAFGMHEGYPVISRNVDLVVTSEADERAPRVGPAAAQGR